METNSIDRFQILSLDGGGFKGLFSAALLAKLEDDLGTTISEHFDLIVGTSTGGIIALALGLGISPKRIVELYERNGSEVFAAVPVWSSVKHWILRKYSNGSLSQQLQQVFGMRTLASSNKRLIIPSYNLGAEDVYIFKTPHHPRLKRDGRELAWKVALATASAPTYFSACREVDDLRLIDGGVWANNPAMIGIVEAISMLGIPLGAIHLCSIGTSYDIPPRPKYLDWGGKGLWASAAIDIVMRSQSQGVDKQVFHLLGPERYRRINPTVPCGLFHMDRLCVDALMARAAHESRAIAPAFAESFAGHQGFSFEPTTEQDVVEIGVKHHVVGR